jgi:hypothetical protein
MKYGFTITDMGEENFVFNKPAADNTVQQILDD